eukprot:1731486-Prymnesium_polylepis.2
MRTGETSRPGPPASGGRARVGPASGRRLRVAPPSGMRAMGAGHRGSRGRAARVGPASGRRVRVTASSGARPRLPLASGSQRRARLPVAVAAVAVARPVLESSGSQRRTRLPVAVAAVAVPRPAFAPAADSAARGALRRLEVLQVPCDRRDAVRQQRVVQQVVAAPNVEDVPGRRGRVHRLRRPKARGEVRPARHDVTPLPEQPAVVAAHLRLVVATARLERGAELLIRLLDHRQRLYRATTPQVVARHTERLVARLTLE